MDWSTVAKAPLPQGTRREAPSGLWQRCRECGHVASRETFTKELQVCPNCQAHGPLLPEQRFAQLCDQQRYEEHDAELAAGDPLAFCDSKPYPQRLAAARARSGSLDALRCVSCQLGGRPLQLAVFDFRFLGGSMGTVVGEKLSRCLQRAREQRAPALIVSSSGGARMQEGLLSLMQMAKVCTALGQLRAAAVPLVSLLTHPTTGGVAASYAMLGDLNLAEPGALIGFAGPRVIRQTIGQDLPEGFQRSEYLLEHGMIDMICPRAQQRARLQQLLDLLYWSGAAQH